VKAKFIVCSRRNSSRIPNKPFVKLNGVPILEHLINRLIKISSPVYIAIPPDDVPYYSYLLEKYGRDVYLFADHAEDPLKRMYACAENYELEDVIRVSHDKIFIDPLQVETAYDFYTKYGHDYLYSSTFTDGTSFEIISKELLKKASEKFSNVEHISYAVKTLTKNPYDYDFSHEFQDVRLLIDYPEDLTLFQTIFACLGNEVSLEKVYNFIDGNNWIKKINRLPLVSVYTCSLNNQEHIQETMDSVLNQVPSLGGSMEYILIDDFSSDNTPFLMSRFAAHNRNVKYVRNNENLGLASSSNVALSHARGKYIVRIDGDDFFSKEHSISLMLNEFKQRDLDVVYPAFYDGHYAKIGDPRKIHHPAGALFKTRALNHIKFTDNLRHYDGLDLYNRAKEQLRIGYLESSVFFYRHRNDSLSRKKSKEREDTMRLILGSKDE